MPRFHRGASIKRCVISQTHDCLIDEHCSDERANAYFEALRIIKNKLTNFFSRSAYATEGGGWCFTSGHPHGGKPKISPASKRANESSLAERDIYAYRI